MSSCQASKFPMAEAFAPDVLALQKCAIIQRISQDSVVRCEQSVKIGFADKLASSKVQ